MEKIKRDASWNEDQGKWILPDLISLRLKLPYAVPGPFLSLLPKRKKKNKKFERNMKQ